MLTSIQMLDDDAAARCDGMVSGPRASDAVGFDESVAAAAAADLGPGEEEWLEVSRMRVKVGNPNVKIYSVFLTKTPES